MDKAFEILVEQHRPMLLLYASSLLCGDRHRAEDVVQESFLVAYQRLASFRQGENFTGWLRKIAQNKALESAREFRKFRWVSDATVLQGIEEVFAVFDSPVLGEESQFDRMSRWVRHCADRLSDHLKHAVRRVYEEGLSLREAAMAEQVTSAAFAKRISRARDAIRRCVQRQATGEA